MNSKRGFKRITFMLAAIAAITSGILAGMIPYTEYKNAKKHWWTESLLLVKKPSEQELQQFNTWEREMGITFNDYYVLEDNMDYDVSLPTLMESREEFLQMKKDRYWQGLSIPNLVGLATLYTLVSFIIVFLGVWLILWFGGLAAYKLIRWLILGFCDDVNSKQVESMEAG